MNRPKRYDLYFLFVSFPRKLFSASPHASYPASYPASQPARTAVLPIAVCPTMYGPEQQQKDGAILRSCVVKDLDLLMRRLHMIYIHSFIHSASMIRLTCE